MNNGIMKNLVKIVLWTASILGALWLGLFICGCWQASFGPYPCCAPVNDVRIRLQPYGDFSQKEAEALRVKLDEHLRPLWTDGSVGLQVLPAKPLPGRAYYRPRNRYRAGELLKDLKGRKDNSEVTIGLTHRDISTTIHGHDDYGIMGYSYRPGNVCVVSSFRMKNKDDMWKCVIHEFLHSRGLPHCENAACYMKDAHGKGAIHRQKGLCAACTKRLQDVWTSH